MNKVLFQKIYREKTIKSIDNKSQMLGLSNDYNSISFLNKRLITMIILFLLIIILLPYGIFIAPVSCFIYYYLVEYICFDSPLKERESLLNEEAITFFKILNLALKEDMPLLDALIKTTNCVDNNLSLEFKKVVKEVSKGKSMEEALNNLQKRIPGEKIRNIIFKLKEQNKKGINISNSLQIEIDSLEEQEYLAAKLKASIVPLKVILISIIFGIALMLLIIFGPNILNMIK